MMWERCADLVAERGNRVELNTRVKQIQRDPGGQIVLVTDNNKEYVGSTVISTMPINRLIQILQPSPPDEVLRAAGALRHRDFLTVALVVPQSCSFPDNWIYIHSPEVRVGRIQNFGSWSPFLVKDDLTCLGMEYFVTRGDTTWNSSDGDMIELATRELEKLELVDRNQVGPGYVVRVPYAYPIYDAGYSEALDLIRRYLRETWPEIRPVGRNGMHRYNNQDHSMYTAMLTVDELLGQNVQDVWSVNVEEEYHEIKN
jgi:protoporphyrinogen oxidase